MAGQMLTYNLFKNTRALSAMNGEGLPDADLHPIEAQGMPLSATSRNSQLDGNLPPVQNPVYGLISNKQERPVICWLTFCSKPKACSCQKQVGRASQIMTYTLFKTQIMLLSVTSRNDQPDADLHPVQNQEHALVSNKQEGAARCWLTPYS